MAVFNIMFIINFVLLIGLTVFYFVKRQKKAALTNLAVIALFLLVQFVESYYITIRTHLHELLGDEAFLILKDFLSAVLFFGSSITVGIQFIAEIVGFIVILFIASKVLKILKICSNKVFSDSVSSENEKVINKFELFFTRHYLILEKLLN